MIKKWILKVLTTVPFYGNVVNVPYKAKVTDKKCLLAKVAIIQLMLDKDVKTVGLMLTNSDLAAMRERVAKYDVSALTADIGKFTKQNCVQTYSLRRRTFPVKAEIVFGALACNGNPSTGEKVVFTSGQFNTIRQRYTQAKNKLRYELSLKQKFALFLNKVFKVSPIGRSIEVCNI